MARRIKFEKGNYYHIYNRGAHRKRIFLKKGDYSFLLQRIEKYFQRDTITMIAYCLMPNHYHFLIRPDGNVSFSQTMQSIFNSYSKGFNSWYQHTGTIFEGPFKSVWVDSEEHVVYLCRYIHRNPIDGKRPLVDELNDWPFSNYLEWIGARKSNLVDEDFVATTFPQRESYRNYVLADQELPQEKAERFRKYLFG